MIYGPRLAPLGVGRSYPWSTLVSEWEGKSKESARFTESIPIMEVVLGEGMQDEGP